MCEQQLLPTLSKSHVCATTGQRLQQCCRRSSSRSSKRASGATLFPAALQAQVRGVAPGEDRRLSQQLRCCARACMLYALLNRHETLRGKDLAKLPARKCLPTNIPVSHDISLSCVFSSSERKEGSLTNGSIHQPPRCIHQ